ncbi:MAG: hypothetical protein AAGI34_11470 [Pseudomonadota bacterium]
MYANALPSERVGVLGAIDPDVTPAGSVNTGWLSLVGFHAAMALIMTGTLGAGATVDARLQQATSASGADAKDIADKAITQIVKAGGDDKQAIIDLRDTDLDIEGGFAFIRLVVTVGGATSDVGALVLGFDPREAPPAEVDAASVVEIV